MEARDAILARLRADAREADALHERSRRLLVEAARAGATAGLSQRDIAQAIRRSQPEVSRLLRFHGTSTLGRRLSAQRASINELVMAHGMSNVRVFGSVARGTDTSASDIDLLVDLAPGTGLFAVSRLEVELTELIGVPVDVVPARSLREHLRNDVLTEAIPL